jgi:O-antigen/teichoic acid export membrane protein
MARRVITGLERDTALVLAGTTVANVGSYVFHVLVSRHLGPTSYGALAAILGIGVVVAIPSAALQYAVARGVTGQPEAAAGEVTGAVFRLGALGGLAIAAVMAITSPLLSSFLRTGIGPILWAAAWMVPTGAMPALLGYLQGRRRFVALTLSIVVNGAGRVVGAAVVVRAGGGVGSCVAVMALATAGAFALAAVACGPVARFRSVQRATVVDVARTTVPLVGLSLLAGMDVVFARHYLSARQAGYYAAASVAGKIVLWAPAAVTLAAFPEFVERPESGKVLARAVGLAGAICAGAVAVILLFRDSLIGGIFGNKFLPASDTVLIVAMAMSVLTILQVVTMWAVARRAYLVGPVLLTGAAAIALLMIFSNSSPRVIAVDLLVGIPSLLAIVWVTARASTHVSMSGAEGVPS